MGDSEALQSPEVPGTRKLRKSLPRTSLADSGVSGGGGGPRCAAILRASKVHGLCTLCSLDGCRTCFIVGFKAVDVDG